MKVVLAFDKFKGSATAQELIKAAQDSLRGLDHVSTAAVPIADGGDGTTAVLAANRKGQWITSPTMGPLLQQAPVTASYFLCDDGTALIETAAASGLALVPAANRDVMRASTFGSGLLLRDAMEHGCSRIVLGLGGSATCDAGMGILSAMGAEFLDGRGRHLYPCGASLEHISLIETRGIPRTVLDCHFTLLTDVDNPLCGPRGTAAVFAPQKGASPQQVELLERGTQRVARIVGHGIADKAGCGAAGGIPALMLHLLDAELLPGAPYVLEHCGLAEALDGADLVITGEGRLDRQTFMGKGPGLVIKMAQDRGLPVAAVCGTIAPDLDPAASGLLAAIGVSDGLPTRQAMDTASTLARVAHAVRHITQQNADLQRQPAQPDDRP